jgi:thiamine pyrophosphokinase
MHAVIFTGGKLRPGISVEEALESPGMVIAADSGAETALEFQTLPSVVIGDFDSLDKAAAKALKNKGVRFIVHDTDKDHTDTELAVAYAIKQGADRITVLGGIEGDRIDHVLANVFSVIDSKVPVRFVNGPTTAWIIKGPADTGITGRTGDLVSLIPLTPRAAGLQLSGLRYSPPAGILNMNRALGVSNVMTRTKARVSLAEGTLLIVHSRVHPA